MEQSPITILLGTEERQILDAYKAANGLSQSKGTSAAIRQIIREYNRIKFAEMNGQIRRTSRAA